jgi:hypothetical protein
MRIAFYIVATSLFLAGLVFFLQGVSVLPGSYMTGDPRWVVNGSILIVVAVGLYLFARSRG